MVSADSELSKTRAVPLIFANPACVHHLSPVHLAYFETAPEKAPAIRSAMRILKGMKYFLVTYGCQMNQSDAERIAAVLEELGFEKTENEAEANILGVVACSVRQTSINRVYGRIVAWNERRDRERVITFVSGCILDRDRKKFAKLYDLQFSIEELPQLPGLLATYGVPFVPRHSLASDNERTDYWKIAPLCGSEVQAWIPIQNGCNRFCAYCAVPYTRGREVSRDAREILDEISRLLGQGYRRFTLLGQNVNSYGRDREGSLPVFARLLDDAADIIEKSGREALIHFTSPHPSDMSRDVFEVMRARRAVARQVHLPLQSGDDAVLSRMRRSYTLSRYREIIGWIRELVPEASLFTDIIVGFPGESEAEFENTRLAMEEFQFDMAFVAMYSPRPGTAGSKMKDDVPQAEKNRRLHVLADLLKETAGRRKAGMVGRIERVLVDGIVSPGVYSARTGGLIPVHIADPSAGLAAGMFVDTEITAASPMSLAGRLV